MHQIIIHIQKVKTPKQESTVFCFLQSIIHPRFHPSLSLLTAYSPYNLSHKNSFPSFPVLHCTSPHFSSRCFVHFTSLYCTLLHFTLDSFSLHFRFCTSLDSASLHFSMISSTLYLLLIQLNYHFPYPLFKSVCFAGENS